MDESGFNDHLYQNDLWGLLNIKFSGPASKDRMQEYIFLIVSPGDSYAHKKFENYALALALNPGS